MARLALNVNFTRWGNHGATRMGELLRRHLIANHLDFRQLPENDKSSKTGVEFNGKIFKKPFICLTRFSKRYRLDKLQLELIILKLFSNF